MKKLSNLYIGNLIRQVRRQRGITQKQLALASGTGLRFIGELEAGKPTCEIDKVLTILHTLGIEVILKTPEIKNG